MKELEEKKAKSEAVFSRPFDVCRKVMNMLTLDSFFPDLSRSRAGDVDGKLSDLWSRHVLFHRDQVDLSRLNHSWAASAFFFDFLTLLF